MTSPDLITWPYAMNKPTIYDIISMAGRCLGHDKPAHIYKHRAKADPITIIMRQAVFMVSRHILGISTPEIARLLKLSTHTHFTDRGFWPTTLRESNAGKAIANEIIYCLIRQRLDNRPDTA